ncbi:MAG: hypothetical protein V2I67_08070 [Thermoanaerobaculales bacterium]|jgi:hypothetical protein|nr:hypothetical protein [Thermoanaerobaculales bacterium]
MSRTLVLLLAALALLCVANSFASHLTPDLAIYLLHARSFVETLNRFTVSVDSKGLLQTALLAPAVWLVGANMKAAAATQALLHLLGALGLFVVVRSYLPRVEALGISLIQLTVLYSHLLWGGNARPEDFAVGYLGVVMVAFMRSTPGWSTAGGAAVAAAFLTKSTLVLGPVGVLVVSACFDPEHRELDRRRQKRERFTRALAMLGWMFVGFAVVVAAAVVWLALFDDTSQWWFQSFVWPASFHPPTVPGLDDLRRLLLRLIETRLVLLLIPAVAGFWLGWRNGYRRQSVLGATIVGLELVRVVLENGQWRYSLTLMVPALLIGSSLLDRSLRRHETTRLPGLLIPVICLLPLLAATALAELEVVHYRLVKRLPSPSEDLAAAMREAGYRSTETIFPVSWGTPMFVLLDAPRPYRTLPRYFTFVDPEEQAATRAFYRDNPPVWVLLRREQPQPVRRQIGGIDFAYHLVADTEGPRSRSHEQRFAAGESLSPILSPEQRYQLTLDTGEYEVWRRVEAPRLE